MPVRRFQTGRVLFALFVASLSACDDEREPDATPRPDAGQHDGGQDGADGDGADRLDAGSPGEDAGDGQVDAGGNADAGSQTCGHEVAPTSEIQGTEGLAIAPDGTLFYSQYGAVGRRRPGLVPENGWLSLGDGAGTVWGMALADDGALYVASPAEGRIYRVDTRAARPVPEVFSDEAGGANGLTLGPDGAVYTTDFSGDGHVHRFEVPGGARSTVTRTPIASPNGLLFRSADTLLVLSYSEASILPLTLGPDGKESARGTPTRLDTQGAALDGIAQDERGRIYVTDNANGVLVRFTAQLTEPEALLRDLPSAANMAFGKGALDCLDLYVTSGGELGRYHADVTGSP